MSRIAVFQLLRPVIRFLERKTAFLTAFLGRHYTPLAVIVLFICGGTFIFITSYLFRYNHWNYWLWKSRAVTKTLYLGFILAMIKIVLEVL